MPSTCPRPPGQGSPPEPRPHSPEQADAGDQEKEASACPAKRPHVLPPHVFCTKQGAVRPRGPCHQPPPQGPWIPGTHHPAAGGSRPRRGSSIVDADRDSGSQLPPGPHSSPGPTHLPHSLGTNARGSCLTEPDPNTRLWGCRPSAYFVLDPGLQAPSPSPLRPRGPGPQPLLPQTQGSGPPAPAPSDQGSRPQPLLPQTRGPGPQPLLPLDPRV